MGAEYLGKGKPDGTVLGHSATEKIAFFNATPVAQQTAATAVGTASATTGSYGFATGTQADAIVSAVNQIITNLANLGLDA
jgi:hypothetical protein